MMMMMMMIVMAEAIFWNLRRKKYRERRGDECCWGRIGGGCAVRRRFEAEFCAVEGDLELAMVFLLCFFRYARLLFVLGGRAAG